MPKLLCKFMLATLGCTITQMAVAEYFGLPNGRGADLSLMANTSVEGSFVTGDLSDATYDHFGVRVNRRIKPGVMAFGDIGKTDLDLPGNSAKVDDTPFGAGFFYQINDLFPGFHSAVKASYHNGKFTRSGATGNLKTTLIVGELLIGGSQPLNTNGIQWYTNLGVHRLTSKPSGRSSNRETEFGIGGGFTISTGFGEAYVGIDYVDEITFGLGVRYNVN